jgi:phthiocerol/phenolphthiocerol synthesis type-I polyketide synthase E
MIDAPRSTDRTHIERVVVEIWQRELSAPAITLASDFFAVGGDSLRMLNMLFRIKATFGVEVPPGALFDNSTAGAFALVVELATEREFQNGDTVSGRV